MSTEIDNHIVQMELRNSQFEKNANQTMSTLDELKKKLNFDNVSKGFDQLDAASKKVSLAHLSTSLDTIASRFTNLGIMGVTALQNVANAAINTGKVMLKSLTIDPISQGFGEYELKMGSIQTIMAGTGESLSTVAGYLDELNQYADKTIYSFANMTNSIGKFTNAGVPLEQAVAAIKGISNEAALAGASTEQASHAMYNFAQALSSGYVKLIDWKSIEIANMATKDFKQQLIDTAVELGTLVKVGDEYKSTTANATGATSGLFNATKNFNDNLQSQWMTTEVLVKTLGMYADESTDVGKKATQAATEVKTFSMMMAALKEAVGSGWATTWENIFGDFEEAKELWTRINNVISGVIDKQSDSRNLFLKTWKELGGRAAAIEGLANILNRLGTVITSVSNGFKEIFPAVSAKSVANAFKMFEKVTKSIKISGKTLENVKQTAKGFFSVFSIGYSVVSPFAKTAVKLAVYILPSIGRAFLSITGNIGKVLSTIDELNKKTKIFDSIANFIGAIFGNLLYPIKALFDFIADKMDSVNDLNFDGLLNAFKTLAAWLDDAAKNIDEFFNSLYSDIVAFVENVKSKGLWTALLDAFSNIWDGIVGGFQKAYNSVKAWISSIIDAVNDMKSADTSGVSEFANNIQKAFESFAKVGEFFSNVWNNVKNFFVSTWEKIQPVAEKIWSVLKTIGNAIYQFFAQLDYGNVSDWISTGLIGALFMLVKNFIKVTDSLVTGVSSFKDIGKNINQVFVNIGNGVNGLFKQFQENAKRDTVRQIAVSLGILAAAMFALGQVDTVNLMSSFGVIGTMMTILVASAKQLNSLTIAPDKSIDQLRKIAKVIVILSIALSLLSKADPQKMIVATMSIGAALVFLAGTYAIMAEAKSKMDKDTDKKPIDKIINSISSAITAVPLILSISRALKNVALAIIGVSAAIVILGSMDTGSLVKGIISVTAVLAVLIGTLKMMSVLNTAKPSGLIRLAVGLLALCAPIEILGHTDLKSLAKGVLSIGTALVVIAGAMALINKVKIQFVGVIGLALGLLALSAPIEVLGHTDIGSLAKGIVSIGVALVVLGGAISLFPKKATATIAKIAGGLIVLGAALLELAVVIRIISGVDWKILLGAAVAIPMLFAGIGLAFKAFPNQAKVVAVATSMTILSTAFNIFAIGAVILSSAIIKISSLDFAGVAAALISIGSAVAVFSIAAVAMSKHTAAMLTLAASIYLFAKGIEVLGKIAPTIAKSGSTITDAFEVLISSFVKAITNSSSVIVSAIFVLAAAIIDGLKIGVVSFGESLSELIIDILDVIQRNIPAIVSKAMVTLNTLMDEIAKAAEACNIGISNIILATATVAAFIVLFEKLAKIKKNAKQALLGAGAIALAMLEVGTAIGLVGWIGTFSDMETILSITTALVASVIVFTKLFDDLARISKSIKDAIVGALGVAAVMGVIGTVMGILAYIGKDTPPDILLAFAASISAVLIAAAVAMKLLNGMDVKKGIEAVAVLMFAVMGITAVVALLGMYADKVLGPEFEDTFNGAISLMTKLGQAIGGLIGGLYGGVIEGAGSGAASMIVQMGEAMVSLGTSLRTFFDTVSGSNADAVGLALSMVGVIAAITGTELLHQIVAFIAEDPVDTFVDALDRLAPGLVSFSEKVKGIKNTDVAGAVTVGRMLSDLVEVIPTEGGLGKLFTGTTDYSKFADGMKTIGEGIVKFADAVYDVDTSGVPDAVKAGNDIAGFIDNFDALVTGGVIGWWTGEVDYTNFGNNIEGIGTGIKKFAIAVKDINMSAINAGTRAGKTIAGFIDNFDSLKVGGVIQDIFGETNYSDFIENLPGLGTAIKQFGDNTADLNEGNVNAAVSAGEAITGFAETLQTKGGVISWFTGEKTTLGEFAADLTLFATSLGVFGATVSSIEDTKITNVVNLLSTISSLLTVLDNTGLGDFEDLSESLRSVGGLGIEEFINGFTNSYDELYNAVVLYLTAIYKAIDDCSPNVEKYTTMCFANVKAKIDDSTPYFVESAQAIINAFASAIEDPDDYILTNINDLFEKVFEGMTDESSEMAKRNTSYGATMVTYIGDGVYSMWSTLSNQLYNTVSQAITPLSEEGSEFHKAARKIGTNAATWVMHGVLDSSSPIKSSIHDTFTSLARALQEDETVKTPYKSLGSKLLDFIVLGITSNYLTVKEAMSSTISSMYQDGLNTTEALKKGVTRGLPSVSDSGKAMGDTMLRSFDRVMEIHSPPRTMIKRGELIPEGTAIGIHKKLKVATDAFDDMAKRELDTYDATVKKRSSQSTQTYSEYWDEMRKIAGEGIENYEDFSLDQIMPTGIEKHNIVSQQIAKQGKEDGKSYADAVAQSVQNETKTVVNSTDELVLQVIRGEWGNGIDRINRLTAAGYNYRAVQDKVNEALGYMSKASAETTAAMAKNNEQALADSFFDPEEIKKQTDTISSAGSDAYSQLAIDNASAMTSSIESSVNNMMSNVSLDSFNVDTNSIISQVTEGFSSANFDMSQYMDFSNIDSESVLSGMFGGGNIDISQFFNFSNIGSSITSSINTQDLDMTADLKLNPIVDMDALNRQLSGVNLYIPSDTTMGPTQQPKSKRASFGVNASWGRLAATLNGDRQKVNMSERPVNDNTAVVTAINDVKTELQSLSDRMTSLEVVLDDRTLVGKMVSKLDRALGARVTRARRGV